MSLMNTLMLSCRKATELMERSTMGRLPAGDRLRLWMHLKVCDGCRAFERQNVMIDRLMTERDPKTPMDTSVLEKRVLDSIDPRS